jgi:hypothetical protein
MRQARACFKEHTKLLATRTLFPLGKMRTLIQPQSSAVVTHSLLAASHFTYPRAIVGLVNQPVAVFEPDPLV